MRRLTNAEVGNTISFRARGYNNAGIANLLGLSEAAISIILRTFDAVKASDWEAVKRIIRVNTISLELVKMCCDRLGVLLPKDVEDCYYDMRAKLAEDRKAKKTQISEQQPLRINEDALGEESLPKISEERKLPAFTEDEAKANLAEDISKICKTCVQMSGAILQLANNQKALYDLLREMKNNDDLNCSIVCEQIEKLGDGLK